MVRGAFTLSHCGLVGFRYIVAGLFRVACAVRVGHGVAAEVFEVLLHLFYEVGGFVAVGVEEGVGVGHHHEGGVGGVALFAGGFEFAQLLLAAFVVATGDELAHAVVALPELAGEFFEAEVLQLGGVLHQVLEHVVDQAAFLHVVFACGDFVVLDDAYQRLGVLRGCRDGEFGVGLDGVAQRGVLLVALFVHFSQRVGVLAGAVLLEGGVFVFEGFHELFDGFCPQGVVEPHARHALLHR